jgi:hypothetical protein
LAPGACLLIKFDQRFFNSVWSSSSSWWVQKYIRPSASKSSSTFVYRPVPTVCHCKLLRELDAIVSLRRSDRRSRIRNRLNKVEGIREIGGLDSTRRHGLEIGTSSFDISLRDVRQLFNYPLNINLAAKSIAGPSFFFWQTLVVQGVYVGKRAYSETKNVRHHDGTRSWDKLDGIAIYLDLISIISLRLIICIAFQSRQAQDLKRAHVLGSFKLFKLSNLDSYTLVTHSLFLVRPPVIIRCLERSTSNLPVVHAL